MRVTIEWSKEELEEMIREKLESAGFEPRDEENALQWKTKPKLHVVIQARQVEAPSQARSPSTLTAGAGAPTAEEGYQGSGRLPGDMFPPGTELDALQEAAGRVQRARLPGEKTYDPRGDDDDE